MGIRLLLSHRQALSQGQIQSLQLLSMDSLELDAYLKKEYDENPLLDYTPPQAPPCSAQKDTPLPEPAAPSMEEWRLMLWNQLPVGRYSPRERQVVDYLISSLDERGYLVMEDEEAAEQNNVSPALVRRLRRQLERLEPAGVFAPDLPHCLLRQLEAAGQVPEALRTMVLEHLEDLAMGRLGTIAAALQITGAEVRRYAARISSLNPRPLSAMRGQPAAWLLPDLILARRDGQWEVELNDRWMGSYSLNQEYLHLLGETTDKELKEYLRQGRRRAQLLLRAVERRRETMCRLGQAVLDAQLAYFTGEGALRPMSMASIADAMGVHVSTVSRCVRGKYLQSPRGTAAMAQLFTQPAGRSGEANPAVTSSVALAAIRRLVAGEDRCRPLSDEDLVRLLREEGIVISRRAAAKYRAAAGIPNSRLRRDIVPKDKEYP